MAAVRDALLELARQWRCCTNGSWRSRPATLSAESPARSDTGTSSGPPAGVVRVVYATLRRRLRTAARAELDGNRRSALLTRHGRRRELRRLSPDGARAAAAQAQRERLDQLEERAYAAA